MANTVKVDLSMDEFNMIMQARAKAIAADIQAAAASGDHAAAWTQMATSLSGLGGALGPIATAVAATAAAATAAETPPA